MTDTREHPIDSPAANDKPVTIDVFHNVANLEDRPLRMLFGIAPGDPLVHVATLVVPEERLRFRTRVQDTLSWAWWLLNMGHAPEHGSDPQAIEYRERGNRSLSVSDVIVMDGVAFACADLGWTPVRIQPEQIVTTTVHGTTPLDA